MSELSSLADDIDDSGLIDSDFADKLTKDVKPRSPTSSEPELFPSVAHPSTDENAENMSLTAELPKPSGDGIVFLNSNSKARQKKRNSKFVLALLQNTNKPITVAARQQGEKDPVVEEEEPEIEEESDHEDSEKGSEDNEDEVSEQEETGRCTCAAGDCPDRNVYPLPYSDPTSEEEEESHHSTSHHSKSPSIIDSNHPLYLPPDGYVPPPKVDVHRSLPAIPKLSSNKQPEKPVQSNQLQVLVEKDANTSNPIQSTRPILGVTLRLDEDEVAQQSYAVEHAYLVERHSLLRKQAEEWKKALEYDTTGLKIRYEAAHEAELAILEFEKTHSLSLIRKRRFNSEAGESNKVSPKRQRISPKEMAMSPFIVRLMTMYPEQANDLYRARKGFKASAYVDYTVQELAKVSAKKIETMGKINTEMAELIYKELHADDAEA